MLLLEEEEAAVAAAWGLALVFALLRSSSIVEMDCCFGLDGGEDDIIEVTVSSSLSMIMVFDSTPSRECAIVAS